MKDTSLRVPHGERGKVIAVKELSRTEKDELSPGVNKLVRVWVAQTRKIAEGDMMAGRHGNKGVISRILPSADMPYLPDGTPVDIILNPIGVPSRMNLGQILETHLGKAAESLGIRIATPVFDGATDMSIQDALSKAWIVDTSGSRHTDPNNRNDPWNKQVVQNWLAERGLEFDTLFADDSTPGAATTAALQIWLKEEMGLNTEGMAHDELVLKSIAISKGSKEAAPILGKSVLYDGLTGEPFSQPITVGQIYMLKLIHLVEDKIHARSTGPYSLITQQPLGGKAQFGGQRFGEMEVWALESYSAAYNLQEILTVKSDDVVGRVKTYEAIVKGENVIQPGVPESFNVLVKDLQSLGLSVDLLGGDDQMNEDDEEIGPGSEEDMILEEDSMQLLGFEEVDLAETEETEETEENLSDEEIDAEEESDNATDFGL